MSAYWIFSIIVLLTLHLTFILSQPHQLTSQNFHQYFNCELWDYQHTLIPQKNWLIMFMVPWCGYCKAFKPIFTQFQNQYVNQIIAQSKSSQSSNLDTILQSSTQIATIDCQTDQQLCNYFAITAYPTFIFLSSDKKAFKFRGSIKKQNFKLFILSHDPSTDPYCQQIPIANTLFSQVVQALIQYWPQVVVFGLIAPVIIGYLLGMLFNPIKKPTQKKTIQQMTVNVSHIADNDKNKSTEKTLNQSQKKQQ